MMKRNTSITILALIGISSFASAQSYSAQIWAGPTGLNYGVGLSQDGLSNNGQFTGYFQGQNSSMNPSAFVGGMPGSFTDIGMAGQTLAAGNGINDSGQVAGVAFDSNGNPHGVVYNPSNLSWTLGAAHSTYTSISNSGIVGGANNLIVNSNGLVSGSIAGLWTVSGAGGNPLALPAGPSGNDVVMDVSATPMNNGQVIAADVNFGQPNPNGQGDLYSETSFYGITNNSGALSYTSLGTFGTPTNGDFMSLLNVAVSADGNSFYGAGTQSDSNFATGQGVLYNSLSGSTVLPDTLFGTSNMIYGVGGVDSYGDVFGVAYSSVTGSTAGSWVWNQRMGMVNINSLISNPNGYTNWSPQSMNNSGQLLAYATDPKGNTVLAILSPQAVPSPAGVIALSLGLVGLCSRRRAR